MNAVSHVDLAYAWLGCILLSKLLVMPLSITERRQLVTSGTCCLGTAQTGGFRLLRKTWALTTPGRNLQGSTSQHTTPCNNNLHVQRGFRCTPMPLDRQQLLIAQPHAARKLLKKCQAGIATSERERWTIFLSILAESTPSQLYHGCLSGRSCNGPDHAVSSGC